MHTLLPVGRQVGVMNGRDFTIKYVIRVSYTLKGHYLIIRHFLGC